MKMRYGATLFGNDAYNAFVKQLASSRLGQMTPGYAFVPATVNPLPPTVGPIEPNGAVRLTAGAEATVVPAVDTGRLRSSLANRPLTEAHDFLGSQSGIAAYQLRTWPTWFGRMPSLGLRIAVGADVEGAAPIAPAASAAPAPS
jgi:hypothetical protein